MLQRQENNRAASEASAMRAPNLSANTTPRSKTCAIRPTAGRLSATATIVPAVTSNIQYVLNDLLDSSRRAVSRAWLCSYCMPTVVRIAAREVWGSCCASSQQRSGRESFLRAGGSALTNLQHEHHEAFSPPGVAHWNRFVVCGRQLAAGAGDS